jgi:hypothetical protein
MHILFDISVLCSSALVLTAVAIARHVRTLRASTDPKQDFAHHLFTAAEDQNSRLPHTIPHQTVRDIHAKKGWNESLDMVTAGPDTHPPHATSPKPF